MVERPAAGSDGEHAIVRKTTRNVQHAHSAQRAGAQLTDGVQPVRAWRAIGFGLVVCKPEAEG